MDLELKKKIVARFFYGDNPEDYKDFSEAASDMEHVSEAFLDTAVKLFVHPKQGQRLFAHPDTGHVATLLTKDDFFSPVTEMTEAEGGENQALFQKVAEENPTVESAALLLQKMGWVLV